MLGEKYRQFFETYLGPLPEVDSRGEVCISNPFRKDPNPSMYINLHNGKFNDFGSDLRGDAEAFFMEMHSADYSTAKRVISQYLEGRAPDIAPIPASLISEWCQRLVADSGLKAYLLSTRGLTLDAIRTYEIGHDGERYTLPVYNSYGVCVNVRRYLPNAPGNMKMLPFKAGYGTNRLYPIDILLRSDTVYLHEGEWDTLLQLSKGFPAITTTAGAGSWSTEWNQLFDGKVVYICYDVDEPGKKGAQDRAAAIAPFAKEVRIINLPLAGTATENDVSDYYCRVGYTADDFRKLVADAPLWTPSEEKVATAVVHLPLGLARQSKYKHRRVSFDVQVVGKDVAPYNVPVEGIFKCGACGLNPRLCGACNINAAGGEYAVKISPGPNILELIKATKTSQKQFLKSLSGTPATCKSYTFQETKSMNVEEILIAPELQLNYNGVLASTEYTLQTAYFVDKTVESNRSYRMQGIMCPDPWQQHVTFVLDNLAPLQDTVSTFKMTPELFQKLKRFQTTDVAAKLQEIYQDFEANVTHIVGRKDLLTAIDLVYHSVLAYNFQGIPMQKGWVEFLCIGDTRTGKSETTEAIMAHYQLGELSVAENTSYAGLVGGLQQTGDKRWFLTWGKLPLNDGRLFAIDEASGLSLDDIARMSGIRSNGIAEITKIQTERTTARTRLIWLSNPRSGNPLSSYSHGVQAVSELIGKSEDISRFDFVVTAAKDEVSIEEINAPKAHQVVPHVYTSELCKQLVLWAWSRKPDDVKFTPEAVTAILKYAVEMGEMYSSQVPLVAGANQRIKLARMAVAIAARVFSTDDTGTQVIVEKAHVDFVYQYLTEIYAKPSLNYKGFSAGEYLDAAAARRNRIDVLTFLTAQPELAELCSRQDFLWARTLEEQLSLDRTGAAELISRLSKWRMIRDSGGRGYGKTPGFISILREWEQIHMKELEGRGAFEG